MTVAKYPFIEHGDIESALIQLLSNDPLITSFSGGAPAVSSDLNGFRTENDRWIAVSSEGGNMSWPKIRSSRIDFQVLAQTAKAARDLAELVISIVYHNKNQPLTHGVRLCGCRIETGPVRADDKYSDSPRYILALRVFHVPYDS